MTQHRKRRYLLYPSAALLCLAVMFGPPDTAQAFTADTLTVSNVSAPPINPDSYEAMARDLALLYATAPALQPGMLTSPSAVVASSPSGTFYDCGWATCTIWWSWNRTVWLNNQFNGPYAQSKTVVVAAVGAAMCAPIGGIAGIACGAAVALRYQTIADHLNQTVKAGKCSAWKINRPVIVPGPIAPVPVVTIVGLNSWTNHAGRVCK